MEDLPLEDPGIESCEVNSTFSVSEAEKASSGRDEVKEIKKESRKDTLRVHTWRFLTAVLLLLTATAVTLTTYFLLDAEEEHNFETAVSPSVLSSMKIHSFILSLILISVSVSQFERFAGTVHDAARFQMKDVRDSIETLSDAITTFANNTDAQWPYFSST